MTTQEVPPKVVVSGDNESISPKVLPLIYSKELKQQMPIPQDLPGWGWIQPKAEPNPLVKEKIRLHLKI